MNGNAKIKSKKPKISKGSATGQAPSPISPIIINKDKPPAIYNCISVGNKISLFALITLKVDLNKYWTSNRDSFSFTKENSGIEYINFVLHIHELS